MRNVNASITSEQAGAAAHAGLRQRKKDSSRRAIEDAAWELFAEQGYEETSINDIAERADVAPRTFFRYFPTKEAVMYPQFEELLQSVRDEFHKRPADEPVITSLFESFEVLSGSLEGEASRATAHGDDEAARPASSRHGVLPYPPGRGDRRAGARTRGRQRRSPHARPPRQWRGQPAHRHRPQLLDRSRRPRIAARRRRTLPRMMGDLIGTMRCVSQ